MVFCLVNSIGYGDATNSAMWHTDNSNISFGGVDGFRPWNMSVVAKANGEFFVEKIGQFRFTITTTTSEAGLVTGVSECIELGASMGEVKNILSAIEMKNTEKGTTYLLSSIMSTINVKKYGNGRAESNYASMFDITLDSSTANSLSAELNFFKCSSLRTVGDWDDPNNWVEGLVPNSTSAVIFPNNSGVAKLTRDVTLAGLDMQGGYIIAQTSGCTDGWSPFMQGTDG